jgi:hypothetical protein
MPRSEATVRQQFRLFPRPMPEPECIEDEQLYRFGSTVR